MTPRKDWVEGVETELAVAEGSTPSFAAKVRWSGIHGCIAGCAVEGMSVNMIAG